MIALANIEGSMQGIDGMLVPFFNITSYFLRCFVINNIFFSNIFLIFYFLRNYVKLSFSFFLKKVL